MPGRTPRKLITCAASPSRSRASSVAQLSDTILATGRAGLGNTFAGAPSGPSGPIGVRPGVSPASEHVRDASRKPTVTTSLLMGPHLLNLEFRVSQRTGFRLDFS